MNAWWYTTNSLQLISPFFFSTIFSTRSSIFFRNFVSISHLFFFFDEDQFYTQKFSQFREMDRYFIFQSFKTRLQSLTRTWFRGWQKLREKKKKGTKNSSTLFTLRKLLKIWQLPAEGRVPGRWRPRYEGVLSSFSWKFTESPWPNLCPVSVVVHRPWFAARFNLQTERRHGVCRVYQMVVLLRCLANVSTHDGQMCLLLRVRSYPRVLVHGLILPGRPFVSHIFIPSISLSSFRFFFPLFLSFFLLLFFSLEGRRDRAYSSFPNVEEKLVISQNFIVRISFPAFGATRIRVVKSGNMEHGWDNCDFAPWFLLIRFNGSDGNGIDRGGLAKILNGGYL